MNSDDLKKMTIKEIKAFPDSGDAFISLLLNDDRTGVKKYGEQLKNRKLKEKELLEKTLKKRETEFALKDLGYKFICGIDEVGRGPLAGPVVTAAVIMPFDSTISGIDDSKKINKKKREELAKHIKDEAIAYSYGIVSPKHIDEINILNATKKAMISAIARLPQKPDMLLIDAVQLNTEIEELSMVKGDSLIYSIGAASIIAKVKRDNYMRKMALKYPQYGFEKNSGYGTKEHIEAIKKYGLTPIHRRSFCKNLVYPN